jgi:murein L,D-transpeptidase YafK
MIKSILRITIAILCIVAIAFVAYRYGRWLWYPVYLEIAGKKTLTEVYDLYGKQAEANLLDAFQVSGISYPPKSLSIVAMKQERVLEVWGSSDNKTVKLKEYPFTGFSGTLGPKLAEGDRQIPEGVYDLTFLNPNSSYHLSIQVGYPNTFDLEVARQDGRTNLGGEIFIHGKSVTIGCIPIGDSAIEELFTLVYRVGLNNCRVVIAPYDMRRKNKKLSTVQPVWLKEKYTRIESAMNSLAAHRVQ